MDELASLDLTSVLAGCSYSCLTERGVHSGSTAELKPVLAAVADAMGFWPEAASVCMS